MMPKHQVVFLGESLSIDVLADTVGIAVEQLASRLRGGQSPEEAIRLERRGHKPSTCIRCGLDFECPRSTKVTPHACAICKEESASSTCAGGCGEIPPPYASQAGAIRSRNGKQWVCRACATKKKSQDPVYLAKIRAVARDPARNEKLRQAATTPERLAKASKEQRERMAMPGALAMQSEIGKKGAAARWKDKACARCGSKGVPLRPRGKPFSGHCFACEPKRAPIAKKACRDCGVAPPVTTTRRCAECSEKAQRAAKLAWSRGGLRSREAALSLQVRDSKCHR